MPSDDGFGLHEGERLSPVCPDPGKQNPEESVALFQVKTVDRTLQNSDLLPQREVLDGHLSVACQDGDQGSEQR